MNPFVAPAADLVRIKACCSIASKVELSHDRVVALSQARMLGSVGVLHRAPGTTGTALYFTAHWALPAVPTLGTQPVHPTAAQSHNLFCSHVVFGFVPVGCNRRGYSGQTVVLAELVVGTKGAPPVHVLPGVNTGRPLMRLPTGTLIAFPPHPCLTAWPNDYVSQVMILGMVPLLL